jgi:hypothetical protein
MTKANQMTRRSVAFAALLAPFVALTFSSGERTAPRPNALEGRIHDIIGEKRHGATIIGHSACEFRNDDGSLATFYSGCLPEDTDCPACIEVRYARRIAEVGERHSFMEHA